MSPKHNMVDCKYTRSTLPPLHYCNILLHIDRSAVRWKIPSLATENVKGSQPVKRSCIFHAKAKDVGRDGGKKPGQTFSLPTL